ncbi:reverse transcriptase domain protein [Fusarium oxysporum f. sp. phaseoli]
MESAYQRPTVKQPASHTENDKAMNQYMRTILPVWKTTPIAALHRESEIPPGAASYGFTIHQGSLPVLNGSGRFGPAEVFDAEAAGALDGLKAALTLQDSATQDIIICLDNLVAATRLRGAPSDSSQDAFLEFQALAASHGSTPTSLPEGAQPTLAYLRRIARQKPKEAFETWWSTSAPEQYKGLNLKATTGCPPELSLPRAALHHLLAARTLHGDFAAYHERFDHGDAHLVCSCNRRKATRSYLLLHKGTAAPSDEARTSPNGAVNLAIGRDFTKFIELSKESAFFGKICPRY